MSDMKDENIIILYQCSVTVDSIVKSDVLAYRQCLFSYYVYGDEIALHQKQELLFEKGRLGVAKKLYSYIVASCKILMYLHYTEFQIELTVKITVYIYRADNSLYIRSSNTQGPCEFMRLEILKTCDSTTLKRNKNATHFRWKRISVRVTSVLAYLNVSYFLTFPAFQNVRINFIVFVFCKKDACGMTDFLQTETFPTK